MPRKNSPVVSKEEFEAFVGSSTAETIKRAVADSVAAAKK